MSDMDDIFSSFSKGKKKTSVAISGSKGKPEKIEEVSKEELISGEETPETEEKQDKNVPESSKEETGEKQTVDQKSTVTKDTSEDAKEPPQDVKQTEVEVKPSEIVKTSEKSAKTSLDILPIGKKKTTSVSPSIPVKSTIPKYDTGPERDDECPGTVVTIYGEKDHGKTTTAFHFPGVIRCVSFDKKSSKIKKSDKFKDRDIIVYNGVRVLEKTSPMTFLETGVLSWSYIQTLFEKEISECDWMVIDGGEIFNSDIAEMMMRDQHNLLPFQGTANLNVWKERNMYVDQLLRMCQKKARLGVIWTCYIRQKKIVREGEIVSLEDHPKWIDAILRETDVTIRARIVREKTGQRYVNTVEGSKNPLFKTGTSVDVTHKNAYEELTN